MFHGPGLKENCIEREYVSGRMRLVMKMGKALVDEVRITNAGRLGIGIR
jgi:hypothetical protein